MSKQEAVILTSFLHIGDRVRMQMSADTKAFQKEEVPDGTEGTVVGFYRYLTAYGPNDSWMKYQPGIYEGNGVEIIQWDNGISSRPSCHDIVFVDESLKPIRQQDVAYREAFETKVRIADLPKLPYMVGNIIRVDNSRSLNDTGLAEICRIDYLKHADKCSDNATPYPIYGIKPVDADGPTTSINQDDIIGLVEKGNYWAWENDKSKLRFKDIQEEAAFYASLGMFEYLRCPSTGNYRWPINEAIKAIHEGQGDVIKMTGGLFGSSPFPALYKFIDLPDLSRRLRAATIDGFNGGI